MVNPGRVSLYPAASSFLLPAADDGDFTLPLPSSPPAAADEGIDSEGGLLVVFERGGGGGGA